MTVQLWFIVQASLFAWSPQALYGWRRFLLRLFGCKVGAGVKIRPGARITYPWKVILAERCWIGDGTVLYSLGEIAIGADSVVSQGCYLCAGSHDHRQADFPLITDPIILGPEVWLAAQVFVAPGVTIGRGTVVGARSSVFKSLPPMKRAFGHPAEVKGERMEG